MRRIALALAFTVLAGGCGDDKPAAPDIPPIPSSHDPKGADLLEGCVLAATEASGGIRLLKILHVDDFPAPLDFEFHMMAFEPKAQTWEEAARMWKERDQKLKIVVKHFTVRRQDFLVRDYRVLYREKLTPEEKQVYEASKRTYPTP